MSGNRAVARPRPWVAGIGLGVAVLALTAAVGADAMRWAGKCFPGFLLLPNRLVAVASLPHWPAGNADDVLQAEVVGVGGAAATTSGQVYAAAEHAACGTGVRYTFRRAARTWDQTIPSLRFTGSDALLLFGAFAANGLVAAFVGIAVWVVRPHLAAARALLVVSLAAATVWLTLLGVYRPEGHWLRLHLLALAMLPAAAVQFAFQFPRPSVHPRRRAILLGAWTVSVLLAVALEASVYHVQELARFGTVCNAYFAVVALVAVVRLVGAYRRGSSLERNKIRVLTLAAVPGLAFPAALCAVSAATGGRVPLNAAAFTAFFFPLGVGYAIVRHDLFEIDAVVRRVVYWGVLTALVTGVYWAAIAGAATLLHETVEVSFLPLAWALAVVLMMVAVRGRVQRVVDRLCFRDAYDARAILEGTSVALGSSLELDRIAALVLGRADEALAVECAALYLRDADGVYRAAEGRGVGRAALAPVYPGHAALTRLARGAVVTWYDTTGAAAGPLALGVAASEILVPMIFRESLIGFLALGPRRSGRHYDRDDAQFLRTLANQTALSILHAQGYAELHRLTVTLEHKVAERTAELQESLARLRAAYRDLEQSQEKLIRSEKMATLGRLAAGVAHEVSTPLGAALSSLHMVRQLAAEYAHSVGDADVTPDDHRELAAELDQMALRAEQWTHKAARFILAVKAHTRGYEDAPTQTFAVDKVLRETEALLQHQVATSGCRLRLEVAPGMPALRGDPTKFGQIVTNLITNAIDAYEDAGRVGPVTVTATAEDGRVVVAVADGGCGIRPEHLPRIFDELYTTKAPGRGTGLGLAIVRDLVTNQFGGTIDLVSTPGAGTTFTLRFPGVPSEDAAGAPAPDA